MYLYDVNPLWEVYVFVFVFVKGKEDGENLWWDRRIFGGEVDVELKDAASVRGVLRTRYHRLQQGRLLIVAGENQSS